LENIVELQILPTKLPPVAKGAMVDEADLSLPMGKLKQII
jgi:hypothetical protein